MKQITKNTTLSEVLKIGGSEKILEKYELPCLSCPFAKMEMEQLKIGDICRNYNINAGKLISELKKLYNKKEK